jgi:hypothetical protein
MGVVGRYPCLLGFFEFRQSSRVVCDSTPAFLEVLGKFLLRESNLVGKALVHIKCRFESLHRSAAETTAGNNIAKPTIHMKVIGLFP